MLCVCPSWAALGDRGPGSHLFWSQYEHSLTRIGAQAWELLLCGGWWWWAKLRTQGNRKVKQSLGFLIQGWGKSLGERELTAGGRMTGENLMIQRLLCAYLGRGLARWPEGHTLLLGERSSRPLTF